MNKNKENNKPPLSLTARILLGVVSIPSLILASMISAMALNGRFEEVSLFEWLYAICGFLAAYIALTGKRFF